MASRTSRNRRAARREEADRIREDLRRAGYSDADLISRLDAWGKARQKEEHSKVGANMALTKTRANVREVGTEVGTVMVAVGGAVAALPIPVVAQAAGAVCALAGSGLVAWSAAEQAAEERKKERRERVGEIISPEGAGALLENGVREDTLAEAAEILADPAQRAELEAVGPLAEDQREAARILRVKAEKTAAEGRREGSKNGGSALPLAAAAGVAFYFAA